MAKRMSTVPQIEQCIRDYLRLHPHAVDTERGICEWWLRDAGKRFTPMEVHAAIRDMLAKGDLTERMLPDGQRAYAAPGLAPGSSYGLH